MNVLYLIFFPFPFLKTLWTCSKRFANWVRLKYKVHASSFSLGDGTLWGSTGPSAGEAGEGQAAVEPCWGLCLILSFSLWAGQQDTFADFPLEKNPVGITTLEKVMGSSICLIFAVFLISYEGTAGLMHFSATDLLPHSLGGIEVGSVRGVRFCNVSSFSGDSCFWPTEVIAHLSVLEQKYLHLKHGVSEMKSNIVLVES